MDSQLKETMFMHLSSTNKLPGMLCLIIGMQFVFSSAFADNCPYYPTDKSLEEIASSRTVTSGNTPEKWRSFFQESISSEGYTELENAIAIFENTLLPVSNRDMEKKVKRFSDQMRDCTKRYLNHVSVEYIFPRSINRQRKRITPDRVKKYLTRMIERNLGISDNQVQMVSIGLLGWDLTDCTDPKIRHYILNYQAPSFFKRSRAPRTAFSEGLVRYLNGTESNQDVPTKLSCKANSRIAWTLNLHKKSGYDLDQKMLHLYREPTNGLYMIPIQAVFETITDFLNTARQEISKR